jgi:hypothetical protein|tara:strand:+ start:788 stop:2470 length:1683 start_codon:yes stop_codon:yes gene_type:complete
MLLGILTFLSALTISAVAIYYSVAGLAAIFAAAVIPIIIMGVSLEVGKLVTAVWLHRHWSRATWWLKTYLSVAVFVLMFITSMGIFGFLSKAHIEQTSMSQEQVALIETIDDKIVRSEGKILRWTTEMDRLLAGEDIRVDSLIDREQVELDKINALIKAEKDDIRKDFDKQIELQNQRIIQAKERKDADIQAAKDRFEGSFAGGSKYDEAVEKAKANELSVASSAQKEIRSINSKLNDALATVDTKYASDIKAIQDRIQDLRGQANAKTEDLDARVTELETFIDKEQTVIDGVREEKFAYEKTYRKLEAEVGPIKYIAEFIYGEQANQNLLESAVRWVIIIIIFVFDPLAVLLLIASQYTFQFVREDRGPKLPPKSDPDPDEPDDPVEEKFEDVSEEELAEEEQRELEQLRAEKIAKNVPPTENPDRFDPDEVKYEMDDVHDKKDEEEMRIALEKIDSEIAKENPPEYFGEDEYVPNENIKEEAKDIDKWNKWVEAAEQEVAKEDSKEITGIGAVKGSFKQAEEELQKKTLEGTNYITKVSNKQQRQTTNPEDSDPTSQK